MKLIFTIDSSSGFCMGVQRTIQRALFELENHDSILSLGEIVHNEREIDLLTKEGLKVIGSEEFTQLKNATVLIRAHGEPPETFEIAKKNNIQLIDTTCPVVSKLQKKLSDLQEKTGLPVMIFGKKTHPEVIGLMGYLQKPVMIVSKPEDISGLPELPGKLILASQTTMDKSALLEIKSHLEKIGIEVVFVDSVCRKVDGRKEILRSFSKENDVILFMSGKSSSNGKFLYGICKSENPETYFISDLSDIDLSIFRNKMKVGITGATSTSRRQLEELKEYLQNSLQDK